MEVVVVIVEIPFAHTGGEGGRDAERCAGEGSHRDTGPETSDRVGAPCFKGVSLRKEVGQDNGWR